MAVAVDPACAAASAPAEPEPEPDGPGAPAPGGISAGIVDGFPTGPMAKPHTSQKSSSADWWPDGQVAIG
jgi:hypothetical protein